MDSRRDILKSEVTELQKRLGVKVVLTRSLRSIEECRNAFVEIAKHYASIPNANGKDTEINILRNKVKVLQEEKEELEKTNLACFNNIKILQNTTVKRLPLFKHLSLQTSATFSSISFKIKYLKIKYPL